MKGLPDGYLLGKVSPLRPVSPKFPQPADLNSQWRKNLELLREQRDQAQREIVHLRNELKLFYKIVEDQEKELKELKGMSFWKSVRTRIADLIAP